MNIKIGNITNILIMGIISFVMTGCGNTANVKNEFAETKAEIQQSSTTPADTTAFHDYLGNLFSDEQGQYAVYVSFPDRHDQAPFIYQSKPMRSASMIKVFILAAALEAVKHDQLTLDRKVILESSMKVGGSGQLNGWADGTSIDLRTLLKLMITESDNTATNIVIDLIGMDNINQYIAVHGYVDTKLQRKMMDLQAQEMGHENYTSVKDLGTYFSRVYAHQCIDERYDEIMRQLLLQQTDTECFPTALPSATIAHKTGELTGLYDDGGIIYTNHGNYILCIMNDDVSRNHAIDLMKQIAVKVDHGL
jgi:beta-lactamase class A